MERTISRKQITVFLIVAMAGGWAMHIAASYVAAQDSVNAVSNFRLVEMFAMFIPFLAVLIARIPLKGMGWIPHLKGKVRWIFFSMWMPALLMAIGALIYFAIFRDQFDTGYETLRMTIGDENIAMMESQGMTIEAYMMMTTLGALTYIPFVNMLTAIGEETGWRGALYPYLKERFGRTKGRIIGGVIWGVWHWPAMVLAGYEYGTDYIGAPVLGPIVFCVFTVALGILADHVYEKTGTIWMAALIHGAVNGWTIYAYLLKPEYMDRMIFGPAMIGLISGLPMFIYAVVISVRGEKKV